MTRAAGRDPREAYFDNAKFLLIVLVALGHAWEQIVADTHALRAVHTVVYGFHMPAFTLLCGYFSQRFTGRPDQVRRLLSSVLLPYLAFEALYAAANSAVRDEPFAYTPTEPTYLCWFLVALFLWRLSTPLWRAVRYPLAVSVLVSLTAGLTTMGYELALPRVLMFLPWFVLGLRLRPRHFQLLTTRVARRCAVPVLVLAGAGAYLLAPGPDDHWLSMDVGHTDLGVSWQAYLALRLALFAAGALLVAAFFACVPRRRTPFTALGAVTMYPYLLHGLLLRAGEAAGIYPELKDLGTRGQVLLSVAVVTAVVLLSTPPVRRVFRPLVEPPLPPLRTAPAGTGADPMAVRSPEHARK
ncbi:membrane protein [Streptomyces longispororuber]|uniref:Membrane protein n=1 Tax=Streptomyces longispororuber TaxID=68230 RepID=A0A918ZXJ3_9ACTN|nr:acyltransferase family protein [Streptomyces longispororuber]GHE76428.1 membrane protein [Streptomyces longispororuber]